MGLLDVINGMRNGPHGQPGATRTSGGMSPLTMGLLALLAYKAFKGGGSLGQLFGGNAGSVPQAAPNAPNSSGRQGGLGDLLGGLLGAGAAGNVVTSGLNELVKRLQQNGQGDVARSWVSTGTNKDIEPGQLARAAGVDTLDELSNHAGMSREQVLAELARNLPETVDQLTPDGRVPNEHELAARM